MSVSRAPRAAAWYTGNPPGHIRIQVIGTPPSRWPPAPANAARDRGKFSAYDSRSRLTSAASRSLLMAVTIDNCRNSSRTFGSPGSRNSGGR